MPYDPPPELAELSLAQIAEQVKQLRKLPPVEQWSPKSSRDSEMRIAADGKWYHQGSVISRTAMVRAFSGLLTRDEVAARHWLVTPFEKQTIEVEDAAFIATDVVEQDGALAFRLEHGRADCGRTRQSSCARPAMTETPALYLMVRRGCEARLNRSTYQQLADISLCKPW